MPSFDVVSKVDWSEVANAIQQAARELEQRFDFKGTGASIERKDASISLVSNAEDRTLAAYEVLQQKLVRRKISLKHLDKRDPEPGPRGTVKMQATLKEGIETEKAKEIIKLIKASKLKLQATIMEDSVRVSGKKRDELQSAMQLLREDEGLELDLQFINFRD